MIDSIGSSTEITYYIIGLGHGILVSIIIYIRSLLDKKEN